MLLAAVGVLSLVSLLRVAILEKELEIERSSTAFWREECKKAVIKNMEK